MTEIKQVNVSVCSLSFYFFFSPKEGGRWKLGEGMGGGFWIEGDCVIFFWNQEVLRQMDVIDHWLTKLELIKGGWVGRSGWGSLLLYNSVQIYEWKHKLVHPEWFMKKKKEKEWELNSMNRGKKWILHNFFVGFRCVSREDSALVFLFLFFFLSERVRVTVRAGASLSLTCVREASKRQLPVNWSAGRLGAARHWVKSSEVRRSCVSCRWRLCQRSQSFGKDGPACHAVSL